MSFISIFSRIRPVFDEEKATNGRRDYDSNKIYRLLRTDERNFLSYYWLDYFLNLRKIETHSMHEGILDGHPGISRFLRAHLIDWLVHACEVLPKEDVTLPFVACSIMDRFYKFMTPAQPASEVQLTGLTGLFMASKYFDVHPIFMKELVNDMGYGKYKSTDFIDRETILISTLQCEIDPPSIIDFVLLYYKLLRLHT